MKAVGAGERVRPNGVQENNCGHEAMAVCFAREDPPSKGMSVEQPSAGVE